MNNQRKTKKELLTEIEQLRRRVSDLEAAEVEWRQTKEDLRRSEAKFWALVENSRDVAARKQAENDLRRSEAKFRAVVENGHDGIAFTTAEGVFLYRSSSYSNLDGYAAEEQLGHNGFADIHPEDVERVRQLWEYGLQHPDTSHRVEYRLKHKDGAWRWVESLGQNFLGNPDIQAVILASRDITARKQTEDDLRRSEAKFRAVVENSNDGIVLMDATGRVLYRSPSYQKINGFTDQERIGKSGFDTVHPGDLDAVQNLWAEMLRHPVTVVTLEYRVQHKDGSWKWIETLGRNLLANLDIEAIVLNSHDITERREAEDRRRESEARFRALSEDSLVGVYIIQDGVATYVNPTLEKIFGYDPGELLGCSPLVIAHPDDHALMSENIRRRLDGDVKSVQYEFRGKRKNGEIIHAEAMGTRIDLDGRPAIIGHLLDITERKQAQEALQASEERYRSLFENVPVGIYRSTPAGKLIDANEYAFKMLGYADHASALEANPNDLWLDREARAKLVDQLKATGSLRDFDTQFRRPDGSSIWVRNNVRVTYDQNRQIAFFDGTLQDITESKQAEEELQARNRYIETIMENAPIGFAVRTINDGIVRFASSRFEEIYGISHGALVSFDNFFELIYHDPVEREAMRARVIEANASGDPKRMVWENMPIHLESGEIRYVTTVGIPIPSQNIFVSTVQDVTERVKATEALRKSEALYRAVVENSHDGIVMLDRERRVKHVSLSYQHLTGYTPEEVVGASGIDYVYPEDRPMTATAFEELLKTPGASRTVQYRLRHKHSDWIWIETTATNLLDDPQAQAFVLSSRDITERKRSEEALKKSRSLLAETEKLGKVGGWEFDMDTLEQTWTEEVHRIHEVEPSYKPTVEKGIDFYTPASRTVIEQAVQRAIELGEPFDVELAINTAKGNLRLVHAIGRVDLEHRRVFGFFQDITERKRAEVELRKSQATLATIIDSTADFIWAVDPEAFGLLTFNKGLRDYFSVRRDIEIQPGMRPGELFPSQDYIQLWHTMYKRALAEGPYTTEYDVYAGGTVLELSFNPLKRDGEIFGVSVFGKDITEKKRAEEAIRQRDTDIQRSALEERQRIARDLHDAVSQTLFSARVTSEMLLRQRQTIKTRALWENINHLAMLVKSALGEMRVLLLELRPESLANTDLRTLLSHLVDASTSRVDAQIVFESQGSGELPVDVKIAFYRIAQEALNNVIKHANCSQINVQLAFKAQSVELVVQDNGIGLEASESNGAQMGLKIMRERAGEIGARLEIDSQPNHGTRLACGWDKIGIE